MGIFRFGVSCKDGRTATVVGLADRQTHFIKAWIPTYRVHSATSPENGGWQVYGNFLIHDGPDNSLEVFASIGCVEVMGPQGFVRFNDPLLELTGVIGRTRDERLHRITRAPADHRLRRGDPAAAGADRVIAILRLLPIMAALASGAGMAAAPRTVPAPQQRVARETPAGLLRARIVADYALAGRFARIAVTERGAADLRPLIRDRIDPRLLDGARGAQGSDYRFTPADGLGRHAGSIVIRYASASQATERVRPLLGPRRFFRDTKILTPMVAAAHGDTVVVFFTETAGDAKLRATLADAARAFTH